MSFIKSLDFGQDSAESEKNNLKYVFFATPFFSRLISLKKWLVLGRKGSGKTAACLMLFDRLEDEKYVTYLTPRSLSAAKSAFIEENTSNLDETSVLKWQYIFLLEIIKNITRCAKRNLDSNYKKWPNSLQKLRSFLLSQDRSEINKLDNAIKLVRGIKKLTLTAFKVGGTIELDLKSSKPSISATALDQLLLLTEEASHDVMDKSFYLLVDKVDDLWDSTDIGQALIIGLLRAAKEINDFLTLSKVIVFLRADIFSYLQFHDSDKYRSHTELITWNSDELKKLITLRIQQSTGINGNLDYLWSSTFKFIGLPEDSYQHLINHTLMRPRDLIQLCNICRDKALDREGENITIDDFYSAIYQYSTWKLEDLFSEYKKQYPFLEKLVLSVFYNFPCSQLKTEDFEKLFSFHKPSFIEEYGSVYFEPPAVLLQILYSIGFIGVVYKENTFYDSKGDKFILPYATVLEVHPAFRKALKIPDTKIDYASIRSIVFDQRGQSVSHQINIAGVRTRGAVGTRSKVIANNVDLLRKRKVKKMDG